MSSMQKMVLILIPIILIVVGALMYYIPSNAQERRIGIQWLLPHSGGPENLYAGSPRDFYETATTTFDKVLAEDRSNLYLKGTYLPADLDIAPNSHAFMLFAEKTDGGLVSEYVGHLAGMHDPNVSVLDLPFLFDDYESALKFLDGPGGKQLLEKFSNSSEYKPLAYSMSGGFRILVSKNRRIESVNDVRGMRLFTGFSGINMKTLSAFGINASTDNTTEFSPSADFLKDYDAVETTYSRLGYILEHDPSFVKYVAETNHSISLTIMLVSKKFWDSLSRSDQDALQHAAHEAAIAEKRQTVAYEDLVRAHIRSIGGTIITPSPQQRETFKKAALPVREQLDPQFDGYVQLIDQQ